MFANHEYPKQKIPLINIPPIVYSNQSREASNQETLSFEDKSSPDNHSSPSFSASLTPHSGLVVNDIPSSSSFDTFMKSLRTTLVAPSVDKPKVSFVKNKQVVFIAVAYDSAKDAGFVRTPERRMSVGVRGLSGDGLPSKDNVEITGKPGEESSRFYAKTTKKTRGESDDDDKDKHEKKPVTKDTDDYIFHMYVGSLSVIGLLILFRIIQKS